MQNLVEMQLKCKPSVNPVPSDFEKGFGKVRVIIGDVRVISEILGKGPRFSEDSYSMSEKPLLLEDVRHQFHQVN